MSQGYSGGPHSMGGNSNNLYPPNIQNMSLHPPDYDPRRLFPFGLSPIPEVPSELASEVSSIASSPTPSYEDSDNEIESVRSRGSIMYSGSCDSIKSNVTLHGKTSSESSTDSEDDATEEETEDEQEGYAVDNIPVDKPSPIIKITNDHVIIEEAPSFNSSNKTEANNPSTLSLSPQNTLYNSEVTQVMHQRTFINSKPKTPVPDQDGIDERKTPISTERSDIPFDMVSGAATASEIFRHLQATRGKQEVTTELAKILTVLKTTLQTETIDKLDSSSSDEETSGLHSAPVTSHPMPTGKPPRPPQKSKSKSLAAISPVIQAKIKELEQSKSKNPKEEMNLLSKILVHLLCSCKTVAAAQELKGIIKQFKEVAKVAMEEGDDTLELLRSNSRASSRNSVRRKARSRTASGNSNVSGNSETDSMNTLTPGDSKSSGTDDETAQESNLSKLRFTSNLGGKQDVESCVSYTLTLPLNKAQESMETIEQEGAEHYDDEDEEWEWEYEDELDASTPTKQGSSGSSRNLTPSEGKSDASSGSTRKLLTEMEMGAYNSSSTSHSDHPITEEDDFLDDDDQDDRRKRRNSDRAEVSGNLFCHLEETFKVLSDTYKIITTGNSPECEQVKEGSYPKSPEMISQQKVLVDDGFEGILDGISNQCVQIESEILRSSRQSTATPEGSASPAPPKYINVSRPNSRPGSRTGSKMSRPGSRLKPKTPLPEGGEEEEWGEEDEWEYYYEGDYHEEDHQPGGPASRPASRQKPISRPSSRLLEKPLSRPQSRQNEHEGQNKTNEASKAPSRPASRTVEKVPSRPSSRNLEKVPSRPTSRQSEQEQIKTVSRPNSRVVRPGSKAASRPSSRNSVKGEANEEDWDEGEWGDEDEWEYYYEEEVDEAGNVTSRPVSRGASRQGGPSRAQSKQGMPSARGPSRSASRQDSENVSNQLEAASNQEKQRVSSRQEIQRVPSRQDEPRAPSRQDPIRVASRQDVPQAASRAASVQENGERVPSRIRVVSRPVSRAQSNAGGEKSGAGDGDWEEGEWEYYYEEDYPEEQSEEPANHNEEPSSPYSANVIDTKNKETHILQLPIVANKDSRPNSRNSQIQSRPNSRSGSRPGSRTGSRAASRLKGVKSSLGSVYEEDDQWYYDEDDELARLSPTLTTAPTTRATSPFPNEKGSIEYNQGTGFSGRKISVIDESEETTPRPTTVISKTPTNRDSVTPRIPTANQSRPLSKQSNAENCKTPSFYNSGEVGYLNPMAGVSVALAAEYLGQDANQLVASLPADFIEENQVLLKERKKKKHRRKDTDAQDDHDDEEDKKRRKKKKNKDGKFLPKVGVKELANRLEGELFQDSSVGTKMVITRDEARDVIRESKKKAKNNVGYLQEPSNPSTPNRYSPNKEDKRKTVREMVELMANQIPVSDDQNNQQMLEQIDANYSSNQQNYNIPSISVSSNASMPPPVPPLPQNYYSSPTPQYPPTQYQPYPVEVRPQYPQHYQQENPYQQYPPQPPYQQYQQQYHAYQGYPPPPPPQHYQQYPPQQYQQYPQFPPQGYPQYPPQPPPQPMIYSSENSNQMKVVSGGQTTMVNMRPKSSGGGARQKETNRPNKSPEIQQQHSPDDSEAYGTGSTGSDQTENQVAGIDHDETGEQEQEGGIPKPHKRHSRLFKLLQDSDYTDSETDSRSDYSRISMKNVEDNHCKESDMDSVCSGLERKTTGIDRKHSFRSHKSSNKESDNESVTSSGVERKISPNSMQKNLTTRRFMQLNLNNDYEPSSSELSTPNSPTAAGPEADRRKRSSSKPPSRVWNYHADDFDTHAGVSDDSSYQSLQSLNSFDSIHDNFAGREVEEIMKRKVQRDNLYRYQTDSPHNYVTASPKTVDLIRNSPKTHSSSQSSPKLETYQRASPKFEQELMELANFPSSPGISLRQLHSHRGFYGGGVGK
eukprot:GFUD01038208.1.p1 GENE.GFUD01038208.1~~GFUD01038208.1.p1  ORF type:complete len:1926 (+),score=502.28 GFUD01038208.1:4306-10083(+)